MVAFAGGASLGLASWDAVLRRLSHAVETDGERDAAADLAQQAGLCSAEDVYASRPVSSAELTGDLGEQIVQWCRILGDVVVTAKEEKLSGQWATRARGGDGDWGHYVRLGAGLYLHLSPYKWGRVRATPLWLRIFTTRGGR